MLRGLVGAACLLLGACGVSIQEYDARTVELKRVQDELARALAERRAAEAREAEVARLTSELASREAALRERDESARQYEAAVKETAGLRALLAETERRCSAPDRAPAAAAAPRKSPPNRRASPGKAPSLTDPKPTLDDPGLTP